MKFKNGMPIHRGIQTLALLLTCVCVRNTILEEYHVQGKLSQSDIKALIKQVSDKLYTALEAILDPEFAAERKVFFTTLMHSFPYNWDLPQFDLDLGDLLLELRAKKTGQKFANSN